MLPDNIFTITGTIRRDKAYHKGDWVVSFRSVSKKTLLTKLPKSIGSTLAPAENEGHADHIFGTLVTSALFWGAIAVRDCQVIDAYISTNIDTMSLVKKILASTTYYFISYNYKAIYLKMCIDIQNKCSE